MTKSEIINELENCKTFYQEEERADKKEIIGAYEYCQELLNSLEMPESSPYKALENEKAVNDLVTGLEKKLTDWGWERLSASPCGVGAERISDKENLELYELEIQIRKLIKNFRELHQLF